MPGLQTAVEHDAEREWLWDMSSFGQKTTASITTSLFQQGLGFHTVRASRWQSIRRKASALIACRLSVSIADGKVMAGKAPAKLLRQVQAFIELNRDVLLRFWNCETGADELHQQLRSIKEGKRPD
jgi:hypothetical protein